jgi:N-acyl-D-amino-acid deacylase
MTPNRQHRGKNRNGTVPGHHPPAWWLGLLLTGTGVATLILVLPFFTWRWQNPVYDLTVEFGRVFDGQNWLSSGHGVAVKDGRIERVGWVTGLRSRRRIWAWKRVVSPGFIDTHVHVEQNIAPGKPFRAPNFVRMGVTTVITGNCGTSARDISRMLAELDATGGHVNVATLAGHNTIRQMVLGSREGGTEDDMQKMEDLVEGAMAAGALGFSTGLEYSPGVRASEEEIVRLVRASARRGGIYATHMRNEGLEQQAALDEALRTAGKARARLHISHLKLAAPLHWGRMPEILGLLQQWRARGLIITQDIYLYAASSTSLDILLPPAYRGLESIRVRLPNEPLRAQLIQAMAARLAAEGFSDCSHMRVAYFREPEFNGLTIPEVAARLKTYALQPPWKLLPDAPPGVSRQLGAELDAVLYLLWRGGAQMIYFAMSDADVQSALRDVYTMIGSDSAVRSRERQTAHPRGCGNTARLLARYSRELSVVSLEQALSRLTALPARTFGLRGRGMLTPGAAADLVVFDPVQIQDKATYDDPLAPPSGIDYVVVNGTVVTDHGEVHDVFPGRAIRRQNLPARPGQPLPPVPSSH